MILYVNGTEAYCLSLRKWNEMKHQYEPDLFDELETEYSDGSFISSQDFLALVDFWNSEVDCFNNGGVSEIFGSCADSPNGVELRFDAVREKNRDIDDDALRLWLHFNWSHLTKEKRSYYRSFLKEAKDIEEI